MITDPERAAIAAYPELRRLMALRASGLWRFLATTDEAGNPVRLNGARVWPDGSAEALGIRASTDALAIRVDPAGETVFRREGTLAEVIDALVALPAPNTPGAPHLVLSSAAVSLWRPR